MDDQAKTICALLTPHGRGAVAVVALNGSGIQSVLDSQFRAANGKAYSAQLRRKIVYGIWNSTGEDLIIFRRTSKQNKHVEFEIHCHGGSMASRAIISDLTSAGVEQVTPELYLNRAAKNSIESLWRSEILIAISKATTSRTAEILLSQLTIGPSFIVEISDEVKKFHFESALEKINSIHSWADFGIQLTRPRIVVFCGRPNVGKSSLVNAIVGFQRAIVNEVAGTTRDVVSQSTAIAGWPIELRDTAGLRDSENVIETIGIAKARNEIDAADLKVCVFDLAQDWDAEDQELIETIKPGLIVLNKSDLAADSEIQNRLVKIPSAFTTSVESSDGIQTLIERMGDLLELDRPDDGQAFPVSAEQAERLKSAAAALSTYVSTSQDQDESDQDRQSVVAQVLDCLEAVSKPFLSE